MSEQFLEQQTATAFRLHQSGDLVSAEKIYRQIIAYDQRQPQALHGLGFLLYQRGLIADAMPLIEQAVTYQPDVAQYQSDLGLMLLASGQPQAAITPLRTALALAPNNPDTHLRLASALEQVGDYANALHAYRQALEFHPANPDTLNNIGNLLQRLGKPDQAIALYRQALLLRPDYAQAHNNLACALKDMGHWPQAIDEYRHALGLQNDNPQTHWNLAIALLTTGDFENGFREYEWRVRTSAIPTRPWPCPQWNGQPLVGQRILIHAEQGLGDSIQFARYLPLLAEKNAKVIFWSHPQLSRLMQQSFPQIQVATELPDQFDLQCPLPSLPLAFGTTLQTVPAAAPYLMADAQQIAQWKELLRDQSNRIKVGLIWAGSSDHVNDANRSLPLTALEPLTKLPGFSFHSLQTGRPASQLKQADLPIQDWSAHLKDFADSAALAVNLDLIISVDTSAAHLAGALAKKTWVLLPTPGDWRWLLDRNDSPWYPTMRLFRQPQPGQWPQVIQSVTQALQQAKENAHLVP